MYAENNNHKNIQVLVVEMFKVKHELCPEISSDIFMEKTKKQYSLQNLPDFITPHANSAYMEQNLSQILDQRYGTPEEIKQAL